MKRTSWMLVVLFLILAGAVFAQMTPAPSLMNFQGRLARPDGTPVPNGNYKVVFSIYDASVGGALRWSETRFVTARNGTFATVLGTVTPVTAAILNNNVYLQLQIEGAAPLTPRQQLVTVPYAFKANSVADNAITSASISNGSITSADIAPGTLNPLAWLISGNSGTNPSTQFVGTTDNQALNLRVNNRRAVRYQYAENTTGTDYRSINVLGGADINEITAGIVGATIAGGGQDYFATTDQPNRVQADFGTVSGGYLNTASGELATIGGGSRHTASGLNSTIGGGYQNTSSDRSSTVAGGNSNEATGQVATVGGGSLNIASAATTTIAGGSDNVASADNATVGGGVSNDATGAYAVVGGGRWNAANDSYATVSGGYDNTAGFYAVVGGGDFNVATGFCATIPGGYWNDALGDYSFAAGRRATANNRGAFVWADSTDIDFSSSAIDQFNVRASGGVRIYTNSALTAGVTLTAGDSTWNSVSDRNAKTNFQSVDVMNVLERLVALPVTTWNYKTNEQIRHIGPMAQDFYAAFGLGTDDKHISTVDADGVALAAIQGLFRKVQAVEAENAQLKTQVEELRIRLRQQEAQQAQIEELKRRLDALPTNR